MVRTKGRACLGEIRMYKGYETRVCEKQEEDEHS